MQQHKQRDAIFLPSGFIFNLNVLLWLYRPTRVTAWGPHVTPPTRRLYNNWQSINPNLLHVFWTLLKFQRSSKCAVFFCHFHSAGVKSLDKRGQYMKMEKTVKPLRFCASERMGQGGLVRLTILIICAGLRPRTGSTRVCGIFILAETEPSDGGRP